MAADRQNIFVIKIKSTSIWKNFPPNNSWDPVGTSTKKFTFIICLGPRAKKEMIATNNEKIEKAKKLID